ncbi:MAG: hypothetical protein ACI857_002379 [Arenicella sp.]|jgi:hypothetical protein
MKNFILIGILLLSFGFSANAQVVFNEIFNDGNAATTGSDALGTSWTTACPYCGATNDWIEIDMAGDSELEVRDPNGPATWETDDFDISACTEGVTISVDIREVDNQEAVSCAGACNTGDGIKLEVSYDSGTSWSAYSDAVNGFTGTCALMTGCGTTDCNGGCNIGNYPVPWGAGVSFFGPLIGTDDFTSSTFTDCISVGVSNTVRLKVTFIAWSGSEYLFLDNVVLTCSSCALPVELINFKADRTETTTNLKWSTLSETENKKFSIERSSDGIIYEKIGSVKGTVNSHSQVDYEFIDERPLNKSIAYYRIKQTDVNGNFKFSEVVSVNYREANIYHDGLNLKVNFDQKLYKDYHLNVFDLSGKTVYSKITNNGESINWSERGFYIIEIPEINYRKKIVIP